MTALDKRMLARVLSPLLIVGLTAPAQAQLFWSPPDFRGPPVTGEEPGIGQPIPGATPKELEAHLLWNMRAGLNVAALQCQFSPTLMTVGNYNALLAHHGKEFATAFTTMSGYFDRTLGRTVGKGKAKKTVKTKESQVAFDQYTTKTYNGFSTLHAQLGFCQTASLIGQEALLKPKGQLLPLAKLRMREFRNSLVPAYERVFTLTGIPTYPLPRLDEACYTKLDLLKISCSNWRAVSLAAPAPATSETKRTG